MTKACYERIEALDGSLHAFIGLTKDRALAEAKAAEEAFQRGEDKGPLQGIPYAIKDICDVAGEVTLAGCRFLADNRADSDCTVARKFGDAGMVLLGKTHTVQFAGGITGVNHDQGTPRNPWKEEHHVPGGSSSGSGVAVASGMAPLAIGSDTGGSVRAPSSLCGLVGLKTTVGRVSRAGVYPLSTTLDSIGPMVRSVADAALAYLAMRGADPADHTTAHQPVQDVLGALEGGVKGLRLALGEYFFQNCDPEVEKAVRAAADLLAREGAEIVELDLPEVEEAADLTSSFSLSAIEGYHQSRHLWEEHGDELDSVVSWMRVGGDIAALEYYGLVQARLDLVRRFQEKIQGLDGILTPTTPFPALPLAEIDVPPGSPGEDEAEEKIELYLQNTAVGNFLGLCALSLPCGWTEKGLPIGLQIYARPYGEEMALRIGRAYERTAGWQGRTPDLSWAAGS